MVTFPDNYQPPSKVVPVLTQLQETLIQELKPVITVADSQHILYFAKIKWDTLVG